MQKQIVTFERGNRVTWARLFDWDEKESITPLELTMMFEINQALNGWEFIVDSVVPVPSDVRSAGHHQWLVLKSRNGRSLLLDKKTGAPATVSGKHFQKVSEITS